MTTPTKTSAEKTTEDVAGCAIMFLLFPVAIPLWGLTLASLWNWFLPPLWPHLPRLTVPEAMGLWVLRGAMLQTQKSDVKTRDWPGYAALAVSAPLFTLFLGWLVHLLMHG